MDFRQKILHRPGIFHQDGEGLLSRSWLSGCHHPVVQVGFVDDLRRMSHHFPDPAKNHRQLRVVISNLLIVLTQLLSHGNTLRGEVCILPLYLLELLPVRVVLLGTPLRGSLKVPHKPGPQVPPSQSSFLVYGYLNKTYVTKFIINGITTYMFGARPNLNPSRPCAGLLKVD